MHPIQALAENCVIYIPADMGNDLMEERLAQAVAVDNALRKLLHGEIDHDTYIQMIEPVIGHNQIDNYLEECIENLDARLY